MYNWFHIRYTPETTTTRASAKARMHHCFIQSTRNLLSLFWKWKRPPPLHRFFDTQNAFDTVWRQVRVYKLYKCGVFGRLRARKIVIHVSIFSVTVHQRTTFKNKKINPSTQVNTILKGRTQIYLSDDIAIFALS